MYCVTSYLVHSFVLFTAILFCFPHEMILLHSCAMFNFFIYKMVGVIF